MKVSWSSEDKPGIHTPGLEHEIIVKSQSPSHSFEAVIPSVCVVQRDLCFVQADLCVVQADLCVVQADLCVVQADLCVPD